MMRRRRLAQGRNVGIQDPLQRLRCYEVSTLYEGIRKGLPTMTYAKFEIHGWAYQLLEDGRVGEREAGDAYQTVQIDRAVEFVPFFEVGIQDYVGNLGIADAFIESPEGDAKELHQGIVVKDIRSTGGALTDEPADLYPYEASARPVELRGVGLWVPLTSVVSFVPSFK